MVMFSYFNFLVIDARKILHQYEEGIKMNKKNRLVSCHRDATRRFFQEDEREPYVLHSVF